MKDLIDRKELLKRIAEDGDVNNNVRIIIGMPKANREITFCDMLRLEGAYKGWMQTENCKDDFINIIRFLKDMEVL